MSETTGRSGGLSSSAGDQTGGLACTVLFFFFSSRRRHTRSDRDWSSDVCSSDLRSAGAPQQELAKVRAAGLLLETAAYPEMLTRLEPAAAAGSTFRHTARELLALSDRKSVV